MKKQGIWLIILVMMIFPISGCTTGAATNGSKPTNETATKTAETGAKAKTIKIGYLTPLSGRGATYGQLQQIAINMAVEEINNKGGINGSLIELLTQDDAMDPQQAVTQYRKLASENVFAIFGPYSGATWETVTPIANQLKIPTITKKSFLEIEETEWTSVMDVNLKGLFLCCKAVVPVMKGLGMGRILNVSSTTFFMGVPGFLHYVSSKGGVIGFTRALARELGEFGITVNAIAPGLTSTETNANISKDYMQGIVNQRSIQRIQFPSDLVGAIAFLISRESSFITGQTLVVDGGVSMN